MLWELAIWLTNVFRVAALRYLDTKKRNMITSSPEWLYRLKIGQTLQRCNI